MNVLDALILGFVQGATEWLPVSSSGHLVLVQQFLGLGAPVGFDAFLHIATLLVVVFFFRGQIAQILRALFQRDFRSADGRMGLFIIAGTIPTLLIGILFEQFLVSSFTSLWLVGVGFLVTTAFLLASRLRTPTGKPEFSNSILVGIAQGVSILPSISRSGATIATGMLGGMSPQAAARFSFLLSVPAILGAMVLELDDLAASAFAPDVLVAGFLASAVVGYLTLRGLLFIMRKNQLWLFAPYTLVLGVLVLVFL